jgi:CelD/BcsL family acetyltransferase involved in cellulose biosynthesis
VRVELIQTGAELDGLAPDWEALWRRDPGADVFSSPEVYTTWMQWFARDSAAATGIAQDRVRVKPAPGRQLQPHVLVAREGDEIAGIAPLVAYPANWRGLQVRVLSFAVNAHLPRAGLVCRDSSPAVRAALLRQLADTPGWDVLLLEGVPAESRGGDGLRSRIESLGLPVVEEKLRPSTFLSPRGSWSAYLAGKSGNFRRSLIRGRRDLARAGRVTFEHGATPEEVEAGMEAFLEVDRESWKARKGESIALDPRLGGYYRDLASRCAGLGHADVWVLRIGGQAAAATLCLRDSRNLYLLKQSCKERFSRAGLSPSFVLTGRIVEDAWGRGLEGIDFLTRMPYTERWARVQREYRRLTVFRNHTYAASFQLVDWLSSRAAAARRALAARLGRGRPASAPVATPATEGATAH